MYILNKDKKIKVEDLVHLRPFLIGDLATKQANNNPDKLALVDIAAKKKFTFKEYNDRINSLAFGLKALGVKKGDVVCIVSKNSFKVAEAFFAIWKLRAIAFPMNWRLTHDDIVSSIKRVEPKFLLIQSGFEDLYRDYKEGEFVHLDLQKKGMAWYDDLVRKRISSEEKTEIEYGDVRPTDEYEIATILLTGGTTGVPKGCALSHRAMVTSTISYATIVKYRDQNHRLLVPAPLFHGGGLIMGFLSTFYGQGATFLLEEGRPLEDLLKSIQEEKITHTFMVPTVINRLINDANLVKKYDISTLKCIVDGGEPHDPKKKKEGMELLGANICNCSATQTEGGVTGRYINYDDYTDPKYLECSGNKDALFSQTEVFGKNDKPLREEEGEIVVRGEHLMSFYWGDEEKTKEKIKKGWLRTEDLGIRCDDGRQEYTGRISDLIISGGENIFASEVEWPINQHPAVAECAVFGLPDEMWGEKVTAAVVLKEKGSMSEKELIDFAKSKIASYKAPKEIIFLDEIPKTGLGKTQRFSIKEKLVKERSLSS